MATHAKFLIESTSITFAAILAMLYPSPGFQLGMILVMVTRFALLGDRADVWSIRWLHHRDRDRTLLVGHWGSVLVGHHALQTSHQPDLPE